MFSYHFWKLKSIVTIFSFLLNSIADKSYPPALARCVWWKRIEAEIRFFQWFCEQTPSTYCTCTCTIHDVLVLYIELNCMEIWPRIRTGNKTKINASTIHCSYLDTRLHTGRDAEWFSIVAWLQLAGTVQRWSDLSSPSIHVTVLPGFVCCPHWRYFAIWKRKRKRGFRKSTQKSPFMKI